MKPHSKKIKKLIREFSRKAMEEELKTHLEPVSLAFDKMKDGDINVVDLANIIHDFEYGPSKEIFKKYNGPMAHAALANAIASGIIDTAIVPKELLVELDRMIQYFKEE